jgi:hypothetical protein
MERDIVKMITELMYKIDYAEKEFLKIEYLKREAEFQNSGMCLVCKNCGHFSVSKEQVNTHTCLK